ncbi:MAG TPA: MFS transporter [Acidimicrobiia bacterium]|nr:MFS transporter [Acidimicrobiia bacterium]
MAVDKSSQKGAKGIPRRRIAILGLVTIAVYGSWFYSFGVLLDPIIADTGWSEPAVAAVFSSSAVIAGFGSLAGGWLLDLWGSRIVFGVAAVFGGGALWLAADAESAATFALLGAVGGGVLASLGFYHVTQTAAVRVSPRAEDRAIAVLTIWGAFASVIYIPITAWLVIRLDWRVTLRILAATTVVVLAVAAVMIDTRVRGDVERPRVLGNVGQTLRTGRARRFLTSQALAGLGVGTILVYQVPAMTSAGLALAAASFWAGFRGFAQLGGRLPLMPLVNRFGVANSLRIAYVAISAGSIALAFAGNQVLAAVYAIAAGFGIGAVSPLVGMHSKNVFGARAMGTAMGLISLAFLLCNSAGPIAAAWVAGLTGSRAIPVAISGVIVGTAALVVRGTD